MGLLGDIVGGFSDLVGGIFGGGSNDSTEAAREIASQNAAVSREALQWARQIYADQAPQRQAAEQRAQEVSDAQLRGMNFAINQAQDLDTYNRETFRPIERRFVQEASNYDTPERRTAAADAAAADIDVSAAAARGEANRALERAGIAPGSAKSLALAQDGLVGQSVARGAARTNAVRNVEQQGYSRMADAVGLGRGLAPTQATQQQIATSNGGAAVNAQGAALNATMSGNGIVQQGYSTAINGLNASGNLFNGIANTQIKQDQMLLDTIKTGAQAFAISDKNKKKGTGKMGNAAKALQEIEDTPVHEGWKYDPAKGGPDDGGQPHTGPMAQDARTRMGEAAAPGGKVVDLVTMNGKMMLAIQALAKDVKALKKEDQTELEAA